VARQAFKEGQVLGPTTDGAQEQSMLSRLQESLRRFRSSNADLLFSVYLPFPIMLCQVVTLLTYAYIILVVFAQQDSMKEDRPTFYFPVFTLLDTLCYIGALRVGQSYLNPLGEEADDYEVVAFFNRNLRIAHIYGLFGTRAVGGFADLPMPEVKDLRRVQDASIPTTPVDVFTERKSAMGAFDDIPPLLEMSNNAPLLANEATDENSARHLPHRPVGFSTSFIVPGDPDFDFDHSFTMSDAPQSAHGMQHIRTAARRSRSLVDISKLTRDRGGTQL